MIFPARRVPLIDASSAFMPCAFSVPLNVAFPNLSKVATAAPDAEFEFRIANSESSRLIPISESEESGEMKFD